MNVTIAGRPFYLLPAEVESAMQGVAPEAVAGASVDVGGVTYPVMQVGAVISRQDRRDFSAAEMLRALRALGFSCRSTPARTSAEPGSLWQTS